MKVFKQSKDRRISIVVKEIFWKHYEVDFKVYFELKYFFVNKQLC